MSTVSTFAADYTQATEGCGLLDRSERGKLALTGAAAKEFLHGQVSNDIESLTPGEGHYATFLTNKGKMLGDLRVLDAGDELLLDTERPALQELFNMIRRYSLGHQVGLHKRTLESGLLSLIGPGSDTVVQTAAGTVPGAVEHQHVAATIGDAVVRLIRTDLGLDILCASEELDTVRRALLDAGAAEIGEEAAECVRVERGRPRYAIDIDDTVIPRKRGSTSAASHSPRAATPARRRSHACSIRASRTASCAGCAAPSRSRSGPNCTWRARRSARLPAAPSHRGWAQSRWRWCAARRRTAARSRPAPPARPTSSRCRSSETRRAAAHPAKSPRRPPGTHT